MRNASMKSPKFSSNESRTPTAAHHQTWLAPPTAATPAAKTVTTPSRASMTIARPTEIQKLGRRLNGTSHTEFMAFSIARTTPRPAHSARPVSYTHLRAHETPEHLV